MIFETERLILREFNQSDLKDLCEILQDEAVTAVYEHYFTEEDVQAWLCRQQERYRRYGFGLWALVLKQTGEVIGQAGLTMQPCEGDEVLEISYHLKQRFRHHGYASEAAEGCKRYAFYNLHANAVHAIIKVGNYPSMRVAEAVGMKPEKEFTARYYNGDMRHILFTAHNQTGGTVMKYAFLIMGDFDPDRDRAAFADGTKMIGVSSLEQACETAKQLMQSGVQCIELCGAFGEDGARAVISVTEGKVAVGYVVHFPEQDSLFQALFG